MQLHEKQRNANQLKASLMFEASTNYPLPTPYTHMTRPLTTIVTQQISMLRINGHTNESTWPCDNLSADAYHNM